MRISVDGIIVLLGCLVVAVLPLPRRAEGFRIGFFGALLGFAAYEGMRRTTDADLAAIPAPSAQPGLASGPVRPLELMQIDTTPVPEDQRLDARELLTDFSLLHHLRRAGAVNDREYEVKKADILRRV